LRHRAEHYREIFKQATSFSEPIGTGEKYDRLVIAEKRKGYHDNISGPAGRPEKSVAGHM
jgi:hypothetical protein